MGKLARCSIVCTILSLSAPAAAQTFTAGNREEVKDVKEVTWTATAEAGLVITTGNSKTTTASITGKAIRLDPKNKLAVDVAAAYARQNIRVAVDQDASGTIGEDEIDEQATTAAQSWAVKLRYDRFLSPNDALYVALLAAGDEPAGKELVAGGQLGYSRRLFKTEKHEVLGEAGYDLSYENPVVGDGVAIHSARVFAGYTGTIETDTSITGSVEALGNVNTVASVPEEAGPFEDTRVTAIAALTTKISTSVALSVSATAKYDSNPSPLPPFGAIPYDAGFVPVADELDTILKASLIVTLL